MNLHPLIPNHELPKCLLGSLIIGNIEQIKALKSIKKEIENKLAKEAEIESGELKSFDVTVEHEGSQILRVYAKSRDQAEEQALEMCSVDECDDMEISIGYVKEINTKEVKKK